MHDASASDNYICKPRHVRSGYYAMQPSLALCQIKNILCTSLVKFLSPRLFMTRAYLPNCMNGEATYRLMMQHEPLYTLLEKLAFVPGGNPC